MCGGGGALWLASMLALLSPGSRDPRQAPPSPPSPGRPDPNKPVTKAPKGTRDSGSPPPLTSLPVRSQGHRRPPILHTHTDTHLLRWGVCEQTEAKEHRAFRSFIRWKRLCGAAWPPSQMLAHVSAAPGPLSLPTAARKPLTFELSVPPGHTPSDATPRDQRPLGYACARDAHGSQACF